MSRHKGNYRNQNRGAKQKKKQARSPQTSGVAQIQNQTYKPKGASYKALWCDHWQGLFDLDDGLQVVVSSSFGRPGYYADDNDLERLPIDIGFYLDSAWLEAADVLTTPGINLPFITKAKTQKVIYPWQDYGTPDSIRMFESAITWVIAMMKSGRMVEIGCIGGHGRTGTMLACLLVAQGMDAIHAVQRVRSSHCRKAVETIEQQNFVRKFDRHVNGREYHPIQTPRMSPVVDRVVKGWTDGMTPATRLDMQPDSVDVRQQSSDDMADLDMWLRLNGQNAEGIADSLNAQAWPRRDSQVDRYPEEDYYGWSD